MVFDVYTQLRLSINAIARAERTPDSDAQCDRAMGAVDSLGNGCAIELISGRSVMGKTEHRPRQCITKLLRQPCTKTAVS
jgi:hypothetical protein